MDVLVSLLIFILVFGLLAYLIVWAMGFLGVPEPIRKVVIVIVVVIGILMLLGYLPNVGHGFHLPWSRYQ